LAQCIAQAATDKKAAHVVILDLRKLDAMTDFFVICTGDVDQHVRAIADHIQDEVRTQTGDKLLHREGRESLNWVLLDYVDVVAHVMRPSYREYYRLEDLWGDAPEMRLKKALTKRPATEKPKVAKPKAESATKPRARAKPAARPTAQRPAVKKSAMKPAPAPAKKRSVRPRGA
jgi:ribosome-associated protein